MRRTSKLLRERLRSRVIVTLKSGQCFGGVLWEADEQVWVLREATAVGAGEGGDNLGLDGELVIVARDIAYAQRP